ncbi:MAG: OmpA family protein [Myxococcota bacterium]
MIWLALLLGTASAQDGEPRFNARGVLPAAPNADLRDPVFAWRAKTQRAKAWSLHVLGEYADEPLVLYTTDRDGSRVDPKLDNLFNAHLMGGVALHERVAIHAGLPVVLSHQVDGSSAGFGLGDARLSVPIGVILANNDGFGLSLVPYADLPTGAAKNYTGYDTNAGWFSGGAAAAAGFTGEIWGIDGYIGVGSQPKVDLANLRGGALGTGGLATHLMLGAQHAVRLEVNAATGSGDTSKRWSQTPAEAALSIKGKYSPGFTWTAGGSHGLSRGAGAAAFRLFLGLGYSPRAKAPAPRIVEVPVVPPPPVVRPASLDVRVVDTEGAPVDANLMLKGPEPMEARQAGADGNEGFELPPGTWRLIAEADGFGTASQEVVLVDGDRKLITLTLRKPTVTITDTTLELAPVLFHFDETRLVEASKPTLEECASVLLANPELLLIEVAGHTDVRGDATYNAQLSQGRVDTVRRYLISQGVEPSRLKSQGYGESKPIASGDTEAAHQKNRRVEFIIVERAPAAAQETP